MELKEMDTVKKHVKRAIVLRDILSTTDGTPNCLSILFIHVFKIQTLRACHVRMFQSNDSDLALLFSD